MKTLKVMFASIPPKTKKALRSPEALDRRREGSRLALRELEASAGLGLAVLFALNHAAVAGEEAVRLQKRAQARFVVGERLGKAVTHRARLTGEAGALHGDGDVELAEAVGDLQRLGDHHAQHRPGEIDLLIAAVDRDLALARLDPDPRDGVLALAGGVGAALRVDHLFPGGRLGIGVRRQALQGFQTFGHAIGSERSWRSSP